MDLADYVNATVILYGIADNAAAGAVLRCGPTTHVYIDGLDQWGERDLYATFELTGTLIEEGGDLGRDTDDTTVAHRLGKHYVVTHATWKPLSDPAET